MRNQLFNIQEIQYLFSPKIFLSSLPLKIFHSSLPLKIPKFISHPQSRMGKTLWQITDNDNTNHNFIKGICNLDLHGTPWLLLLVFWEVNLRNKHSSCCKLEVALGPSKCRHYTGCWLGYLGDSFLWNQKIF